MRNKIFRIGRTLLFLSIGIFFLILAFKDVHFEDLVAGLLSAQYEWVLFSLVFAGLAFISRAYRWKMLIEPLGYTPTATHTFYALMSGHLANFIFPRIGEVTRCGSLNRTDKIPFDSLLGTVIVERISDLLALLLLVLTVIFLKIDLFGDFLINNLAKPLYYRIFAWLDFHWFIWLTILFVLLVSILSFRYAIVWLGKYSLYRRLAVITSRVLDGMKSVMRMEKKLQFLMHTIFIWLMYYLMTAAIFKALPSTTILGAADILFIMVVGGLGMAAPVQGGIGAYHWVVSVALGLFAIPREDGLVFATISHESQALFTIILGSFSFFMIFIISKRKNHEQHIESTNLNSHQDGQT